MNHFDDVISKCTGALEDPPNMKAKFLLLLGRAYDYFGPLKNQLRTRRLFFI